MLDAKDMKEIIQLVDRSNLKKFKFEHDHYKLELEKEDEKGKNHVADQSADNEIKEPITEEKSTQAEEKTSTESSTDVKTITSTMVGTFYSASQPGAEPFVSVGDYVQADTVVAVVEAMKLFNEVEANVEGTITELLVEDGELVEHGQPLFTVQTSK